MLTLKLLPALDLVGHSWTKKQNKAATNIKHAAK